MNRIEIVFPDSFEHNITLDLTNYSLDEKNHIDITDLKYSIK